MLAEIMKWFHSNDIHRIELDVIVQNQIASSFWEKHGFRDFKRVLYCGAGFGKRTCACELTYRIKQERVAVNGSPLPLIANSALSVVSARPWLT
jgi:ribosomal protein S18 acetylase RimI-like enzyme